MQLSRASGILLAGLALAAPRPAAAAPDFTLTIGDPNALAPAGTITDFTATLTNTGTTAENYMTSLFLDGSRNEFSDASGSTPSSLGAGDSQTFTFASASSKTSAPDGAAVVYPDSFLQYSDASGSITDHYSLNVGTPSAVPEPSTLAFAGLGLAGLMLRARRRKTAA